MIPERHAELGWKAQYLIRQVIAPGLIFPNNCFKIPKYRQGLDAHICAGKGASLTKTCDSFYASFCVDTDWTWTTNDPQTGNYTSSAQCSILSEVIIVCDFQVEQNLPIKYKLATRRINKGISCNWVLSHRLKCERFNLQWKQQDILPYVKTAQPPISLEEEIEISRYFRPSRVVIMKTSPLPQKRRLIWNGQFRWKIVNDKRGAKRTWWTQSVCHWLPRTEYWWYSFQ